MNASRRLRLSAVILAAGMLAGTTALADDPPPLTVAGHQYKLWFHDASATFNVPVSLLQAIAYAESRWNQRRPERTGQGRTDRARVPALEPAADPDQHSHNQPPSYGVMGLRDDDHFGHSLIQAATLIGRTPQNLIDDPRLNIFGAAAYLAQLGGGLTRASALEEWENTVARYSGIPEPAIAQIHTYDIFNAIRAGRASDRYQVTPAPVDLEKIYGPQRLRVLSSPNLTLEMATAATDYPQALWNPAATCNYGAGRSAAVTHVAEHIAEGTYAGTISWFRNCAAGVSAHYVVRSSDGQVTQMVRESDTAWHVASNNSYSIGIEHEGWAGDCAWYTAAMYASSAALSRYIADTHAIPRTATYDASLGWDTELARDSAFKIKGHTNFPTSKTCPGVCWDWPKFRRLLIDYDRIVDNAGSDGFAAGAAWGLSGWNGLKYGADYRYAQPSAVTDVAWFRFDVPDPGNYEVYVWYPSNSGYNSAAPHIVVTASGNETRWVDQRINGGGWLSLGVFTLNPGDYNAVGVSRWTSGAGYVIADAVRLVAR